MGFVKKITPAWILRIAFALMYFYSGMELILRPDPWQGYIPQWLANLITPIVSLNSYLWLQGAGELAIAFLLVAWFLGRAAFRIGAVLATVEMLAILAVVGINLVTFRDIGLLGGALALLVMSFTHERID